jgi:hypothetical protein
VSYLHKFGSEDIFNNTLETHPEYDFTMYSGSTYVNNESFKGGNIPTGSISLYELNVNRISALSGHLGSSGPYPYSDGDRTIDTPYNWTYSVQSYLVKDGNYNTFKNITSAQSAQQDYGTFLEGAYPLTSSIAREYIFPHALPTKHDSFELGDDNLAREQETDLYFRYRKRMIALGTTINDYKRYSPVYDYSIVGTGSEGLDIGSGLVTGSVNLISIPSIFFGSGIEKGSISLKFYYTGSLLDEAKDIRKNGELISTMGYASGSVVGMALYDEGFILLTSSAPVGPNDGTTANQFARDAYTGTRVSTGVAQQDVASWLYFGSYRSGALGQRHGTQENRNYYPSASLFRMSFRGTNKVPTKTMFAQAKSGEVNNSQNPTWVSSSHAEWQDTSYYNSASYIEPKQVPIKNTIQSEYHNYEESFEKQVFISKLGIYDEDKNLIAVAKLANPVLKKESDAFTFKLKMDF